MSRRREHARPCPTATKTAFPDQAAAEDALAFIPQDPTPSREEKKPARAYRCSCGKWHLTSRVTSYDEQRATDGSVA